jgi:hypothetical protein
MFHNEKSCNIFLTQLATSQRSNSFCRLSQVLLDRSLARPYRINTTRRQPNPRICLPRCSCPITLRFSLVRQPSPKCRWAGPSAHRPWKRFIRRAASPQQHLIAASTAQVILISKLENQELRGRTRFISNRGAVHWRNRGQGAECWQEKNKWLQAH